MKVPGNTTRANGPVLTFGQLCTDWFFLCQFLITDNNTSTALMCSTAVRLALGPHSTGKEVQRTHDVWFSLFYSGSFSSKAFTEAMMPRSAIENAVVSELRRLTFVRDVFDV